MIESWSLFIFILKKNYFQNFTILFDNYFFESITNPTSKYSHVRGELGED